MAASDSVNVLILGGIGFIGRNLVKHIVDNNLASFVRVADKVLPSTAFLNESHQKAFDDERVEYKQSNLTNEGSIKRAFTDASKDGKFADGDTFDFVFNLAAETKFGQTPEVYNEKVLDLSVKVANAAVAHKVKKFVEVSTGQVYAAGSKSSKEGDKTKPWTTQATYKLQAEDALKGMKDLPLVIARPAIVYGPGDTTGISPRIITGAVYKHLGEKMKFLWSKDLKINTVHVRDCVAALWTIAEKGEKGATYNIADKGDTDQGHVNKLLETIFGIKTGFQGAAVNSVARMKLKMVCEISNDKHLKPWSDLCKEAGIVNTPLTPYLDVELLANNPLCVDGSAVEKLGFKYSHPEITVALIQETIDYFVSQNLFPKL
jgi:nucleoside-diphosphate-sugar epimerase